MTRILGDITPEAIDDLEEELGAILVKCKSHHFPQGQKYGHLAVILGQERMRTIYADVAYTYDVPIDQGPYDTTIARNAGAGVRAEAEATHNRLNANSLVYEGVCTGTNDLIIYAVGEDAVAPLKKRYIGFGDTTPQEMITHLRTNVCVKMNMKEKDRYKTQGYAKPWDTSKNIITYFKELENFKEKLEARGIATSTAEMATAAVARMYDSNHFTEEQMIAWENKPDADQVNMTTMKTYFTKIYREHLQYSKASKGSTRFNESANQSYEKPQQQNDEDQTAIMFAQMEQRHQDQMEKMQQEMQKANERAMKMAENQMIQMKEAMMAITQRQGAPTMEQPVLPPPTSRQQYIAPPVKPVLCEQVDGRGQTWRICAVCKRMCTHLADECFEAAKNKGKKDEWIKKRKAQDLEKENAPPRRSNRQRKK